MVRLSLLAVAVTFALAGDAVAQQCGTCPTVTPVNLTPVNLTPATIPAATFTASSGATCSSIGRSFRAGRTGPLRRLMLNVRR